MRFGGRDVPPNIFREEILVQDFNPLEICSFKSNYSVERMGLNYVT